MMICWGEPTASEVRREIARFEAMVAPVIARLNDACLARLAELSIDELDARSAVTADREPDGEDEVVSEDDAPVIGLKSVGYQWDGRE